MYAPERGPERDDALATAAALELAQLGYVPTTRLSERLARTAPAALARLVTDTVDVLATQLGTKHKHEPLFRQFPRGVPADTQALWWQKVLAHYFQSDGEPCLFCAGVGSTHVLSPCAHVVCDRCFDGANYSACPVCEHRVDQRSPFFTALPPRVASPKEKVTFRCLDLGQDLDADAKAVFVGLCERTQAMSPVDRDDLTALVDALGARVLAWLPGDMPVRENVALVFGTLLKRCGPVETLDAGRPFLKTATDVLRLLAVYSGADVGLMAQATATLVSATESDARRWPAKKGELGKSRWVFANKRRFKVAKLSRPLRRAVFALLESFDEELLVEDMLRHRSFWVWLGEHLHPGEYADRFPHVGRAFAVVRGDAEFRTFNARLEQAVDAGDVPRLLGLLTQRPGELGRRVDHALRLAGDDTAAVAQVTRAFISKIADFKTPLLVNLLAHVRARAQAATKRVVWPKAVVARGVVLPDTRGALSADVVGALTAAVEAELLSRFAGRPGLDTVLVDASLAAVTVPFNERSASRAAVAVPRGSRIELPAGKHCRLFMHWCEPEGGSDTDIDLSVAFYDAAWRLVGHCSYWQLVLNGTNGLPVARSGGDLRSAPLPDGATELVDVDLDAASRSGFRWAVMVVNAYSGMPFDALERSFAGLMFRDDLEGLHVDPRTVALKFDMRGDNGVFMPLAVDLHERRLHWLDVYAPGEVQHNNVATSNETIATEVPALIAYFAQGHRCSMRDLVLLHGAARARAVLMRDGADLRVVTRAAHESNAAFLARLRTGEGAERATLDESRVDLAALYSGDVPLPDSAARYVLFAGRVASTIDPTSLL